MQLYEISVVDLKLRVLSIRKACLSDIDFAMLYISVPWQKSVHFFTIVVIYFKKFSTTHKRPAVSVC